MADDVDMAEGIIAAQRDAGVARAQAALVPSGAVTCEDCGDGIPAERRRAAPFCIRCADCQGAHERSQRKASQYRPGMVGL